MRNFADRLLDLVDELGNPSCAGLDPDPDKIPDFLIKEAMREFDVKPGETGEDAFRASASAIEKFITRIIDATSDIVPVYKPQAAFYEQFKSFGIEALENIIRFARSKGRIVIVDGKRNDIESTARAYANAFLGTVPLITGANVPAFDADALTVNAYLGSDCITPFMDVCRLYGKGIFVLAKTSNPSSQELQDMRFDERYGGRTLYEQVALKSEIWGRGLVGDRGYSSLGIVVGASGTTPEQLREQARTIRRLYATAIILAPGYGGQGGLGADIVPNFNGYGHGAIVNNARDLIFAYKNEPYKLKYRPEEFDQASRQAAIDMRDDIVKNLREAGFKRWLQ